VEEKPLEKDEIVSRAKKNLVEGENWHKKVNVREIVFGFNDGSISTLALLAGVTGGALARGQILIAGFSGVIAGAISMAIGAYISSKSEIEHHQSEIKREEQEIKEIPEVEHEEIRQICMKKADFAEEELDMIVNRITSDKKIWRDTMIKEELGLFEERFENPAKVGLIMFAAFVAGGLVPVLPFILVAVPQTSLLTSSILTFVSLFLIGVWKTTFTNKHWLRSGAEMVFVGILAAIIPYLIGNILLPTILSQIAG
jgi:predicted membrane protein (TIGR00267 family)